MAAMKLILLAVLVAVAAAGPSRNKSGNKDKISGKGKFGNERHDKADSEVELDTGSEVDFDGDDNFFGGKGMKNKGRATFKKGRSEFKGKLNSSFADSFMNVSSGARLEFGKPSGGGKHKVGGKGMECKGRMDLRNKTEVDFDGRLHIGKGGRLNVTKGSKVKFGKPKDGSKHLIQGDGIINEGEIEFTDGETDVSAPLLSIGDEAQITTAAASTVTFADVEEVASSRRRLGAGSTTKHEFLGKGSKNEGKTKFGTKHKAKASAYDNEGDLKIEGTDAELSAEDSKQTKGRTVVKSGGILRSNGSKPLKFHGGKMRGSGGTYKGNCELRNSTRLSPGDPDDASSLGRSKLTIDGDLDMDSTTFTDIKMKKTESDSVEITGRAKIAGRLNVDVSERSSESKTFTVLKAAGGIEGTFDGCDGCGTEDIVTYVTTTRRLADGRQLSEANEVQVTVAGEDTDSGAASVSASACLLLMPLTALLAYQL